MVDTNNHRVQEFDAAGALLSSLGSHCQLPNGTGCTDPDGGGSLEPGDGQFHFPLGVGRDSGGNLFVTDTGNDRVEKFGAAAQVGIGDAGAGFRGGLSAFPNPARTATRIVLHLEAAPDGTPAEHRAEVGIFDLAGRRIRALLGGPPSGPETVLEWDGRTEGGIPAPPGIYFVRTRVEGAGAATLKIVRLP